MHLTEATEETLWIAADNLSQGDLDEFHSNIPNRDPRDVLPGCLDETTRAIKVGALVLAVGGHKDGNIWFVTTTVVNTLTRRDRIRFYRMLKEHLKEVKDSLPNITAITNYVSVNNHAHIRLLESLGATFAAHYSMSVSGFQFKQFWL